MFDVVFYRHGERATIAVDDRLPISKKDFELLFCHEIGDGSVCELVLGIFEKAVAT